MDIENLTLKQIKEVAALVNQPASTGNNTFLDSYIGKYVIVRSRNEGINAGFVKNIDETGVVLGRAKRIWYHKPKDRSTSWYEGVSQSGLSDDSKISCEVDEKVIIEDYSLTLCTETAKESILNKAPNAQN